jgi:glucose-1-phosphate adenylyltransferase
MKSTTAIILGGGQGKRLYPLTLKRAKPAVGFAGKYRIIDIPLSNCINSGIKRIFVLTQFLSTSLHRHIMQTYRFDDFSNGFVDILAAEQTNQKSDWFQGPADAVRATLNHTTYYESDQIVILSGDQLYRMNYGDLVRSHRATGADITICVHPVNRHDAHRMGLVGVDTHNMVHQFHEKPQDEKVIDSYKTPSRLFHQNPDKSEPDDTFVASMGIYVFQPKVLIKLLSDSNAVDFGLGIFQAAIDSYCISAYPFENYWQDIGTIPAYFDAHIALTSPHGPFKLYAPGWPVYSRGRSLPPSSIIGSEIRDSLIAEGAFINHAQVTDSVIGVRSIIGAGSLLKKVVLLGEDFYEGEQLLAEDIHNSDNLPPLGIGKNCHIERAIIDKNVHIGDNVTIGAKPDTYNTEGEQHWVRNGITVIPKGAIIPPGMCL